MQLLLIEGVPGSGKTTTAKETCRHLSSIGIRANWYLEESVKHPVHPRSITKLRDAPDFMESCLKQWGLFVDQMQLERGISIYGQIYDGE
jgi:adenylate kinase family enzyme